MFKQYIQQACTGITDANNVQRQRSVAVHITDFTSTKQQNVDLFGILGGLRTPPHRSPPAYGPGGVKLWKQRRSCRGMLHDDDDDDDDENQFTYVEVIANEKGGPFCDAG